MTCRIRHRCNSVGLILEAQQLGYGGAEFDLVWEDGNPVLNHEHGGTGQQFHWAIDQLPEDFILAINVKEYGMADELQEILSMRSNYFIFDVPGPELEAYDARGLRYFGRVSEYEVQRSSHGAIIDSFNSDPSFVLDHISPGDAAISPTLRGLPEWSDGVRRQITFLITK